VTKISKKQEGGWGKKGKCENTRSKSWETETLETSKRGSRRTNKGGTLGRGVGGEEESRAPPPPKKLLTRKNIIGIFFRAEN